MTDPFIAGGVYPPCVPGALRALWATLIIERDMTDAREVTELAAGIIRGTELPSDAKLQLIEGMIWERTRLITQHDAIAVKDHSVNECQDIHCYHSPTEYHAQHPRKYYPT